MPRPSWGSRRAPLVTLVAAAATVAARTPSDPAPVSCSIDGMADYSRTLHFCDLMRQTRVFGSAQSPYDGKCSVGADGWPTQTSFGLVFITLPAGAPPVGVLIDGVYTLQFTGNSSISFPVTTATLLNKSYDSARDQTVAYIEVPPANNGQLWIGWRGATMAGGAQGAKDIKLLQPGCALDDPLAFSPRLVSLVSHFDSLRFMDLLETNGSPNQHWADRRTTADPAYTYALRNSTGIPWEEVAKLVNTVQRDAWINIPAMADDDYIVQLATLLMAAVDPSLKIYFEYSNECVFEAFFDVIVVAQVAAL